MEPIKIEVGITLDFSESVKSFFAGLFKPSCKCDTPVIPVAETPKPKASATPAIPETKSIKDVPQAPAPAATPVKPSEDQITIEMVRKELSLKVNDHRETIKQKLNTLGAPSVTKLDPAKYEEMYNFLKSL